MNKNIFYLIVVALLSACSSGGGGSDNYEPINSLESQIVGKTFWRSIEGPANDPWGYIPHYYGIEFNKDGYIYTKYCSDSLLVVQDESTILHNNGTAYNNYQLSSYTIKDSLIKVNFAEWEFDEWDPYDEEFWSNHIINMNSDISYDEYQGMLLYSDYINLDIKNSTFEDLTLSIGIKEINDKNIRLVWNRKLWYILGLDYNSQQNFFNSFWYYEAIWNSTKPNCDDYQIFMYDCNECYIIYPNHDGSEEFWQITSPGGGDQFCGDELKDAESNTYIYVVPDTLFNTNGTPLLPGFYGPGSPGSENLKYEINCEYITGSHDH